MAQFMVVSDEPLRDYQEFLTQAMRDLSGYKVGGIALVALLEEPDEDGADALTAYPTPATGGKSPPDPAGRRDCGTPVQRRSAPP